MPPLPPPRYMPVTSILTASLARSSAPLAVSSSCIAKSSGASRVNCRPRFSSRCVSSMPTSKFTRRGDDCPAGVTDVRTRSVATRFSVGSIGSPVHCTKLPSATLNSFNGITGMEYLIVPPESV